MSRHCISQLARIVLNPESVVITQSSARHIWKNMDYPELQPPSFVRGMTELDRNEFRRVVRVPKLTITQQKSQSVLPIIKKYLLKMDHLKPVRAVPGPGKSVNESEYREILLHPGPITGWESLPSEIKDVGVEESDFSFGTLELKYENWRADEVIKSILPVEDDGFTSYSRIGHIVHINLRDYLQPYKKIIGDVFRDKVVGCRTVVNKVAIIQNAYRRLPIELVCGEEDYHVYVKENGARFEFDFSKVYWNPRLSTEHERIVKLLQPGDVLYDIFAGVGPFSIPAGKKRCIVLANDLNPDSYKWLTHNVKKNKCTKFVTTYNEEGKEFIKTILREDLIRRLNEESPKYKIHITMNLPSTSTDFIGCFRNLISVDEVNFDRNDINYPLIHLYTFIKGDDNKQLVQQLTEHNLGLPLGDSLESVTFVRNVAPNKDMFRVAFYLTKEMLTTPKLRPYRPKRHSEVDEAPSPKITCST